MSEQVRNAFLLAAQRHLLGDGAATEDKTPVAGHASA